MRYVLIFVCTLTMMPLVGCSESGGGAGGKGGSGGSQGDDYFGDRCPGCRCEGGYVGGVEQYTTTLECFCCRIGCEPAKFPEWCEEHRITEYDCGVRKSREQTSFESATSYHIDTTTDEVVYAWHIHGDGVCGGEADASISAGDPKAVDACEITFERTCRETCCGDGVGPFACTEEGIREAIAAGGGPHRFDCGGPTTISTPGPLPVGGGDVILDGEGNLIVEPGVEGGFRVLEGIKAEFRGFTVSGRGARYPAGTWGFSNWGGTLILVDTVVSEHVRIGGILSSEGRVVLLNSTVSGNSGSAVIAKELTLTNSTLSGSETAIECKGTCTAANTLIRGVCTSPITSDGYNIESPGDTCGFDQSTDQIKVLDPMLGPLEHNGGPTQTHALLPGSVAIDQIPEADCVDADGQPLTTDQRGEPRPETGGTMCDVGAFEVQP
jgi:hypothetical protein